MNTNFIKFPTAVLEGKSQEIYSRLYGSNGIQFVEILNSSPDEIAVLSRIIAYLKEHGGGNKTNGSSENGEGNRTI